MAFLPGWTYRKKLTVDSTKVDASLSDFPILVKLDNSNFDFSKAKSDGADIRFTESDGETLLKFERESHVSDSYTKLLLHCDGTDGSTTFIDSSGLHSPSANGSAQIDTAQSKFGGASGLFGTFSDYVQVADSSDWDLGSEDFTIEGWLRLNSSTPSTCLCARTNSPSSYFYIAWEGGNLRVRDFGGTIDFSRAVTETTGSWFHLAIVRSGNNFYIFKDGVQQGTTFTSSDSFIDRTDALDIGRMSQNGNYYIDGWLDDFRWSKGIARWTSNFTPETSAYQLGAQYHVKNPTISNSVDTDFYMYYGNAGASDGEDAINTWDSNFLFVSHMYDVTTSTIKNSIDGSSKSKTSANNPLEADGEVYKAQDISSDNVNLGDIDIDGNGTIEALVNPDNFVGTFGNTIASKGNAGGASAYADLGLFLSQTNGFVYIQTGDTSSFQAYISTLAVSTGSWQYVAGRADGTDLSAFLGTTKQTTAQTTTPAGNSTNYRIGKFGDSATPLQYDGKIGEVRISDTDRSDAWLKATKETLFDTLLSYGSEEEALQAVITDTLNLDDNWLLQTNPESAAITDTLNLDDNWLLQTNPGIVDIDETVILDDTWAIQTIEKADYISKILSINPLIFVTDTNPAKIFKVDITDPTNPITTGTELIGVQGARSVSYNSTTGFLYVACESGKVVKVDFTDLSIQTIIDLNDTDDLETIDNFDTESITFISTDSSLGELHMLDEREVSILDTNFQFLQENINQMDTAFDWINASLLDTDFQFLGTIENQMNTDFKWTPEPSTIAQIGRTDFDVKINSISLSGDDLVLDSIIVTHTIGEEDTATFRVARHHDDMNNTLDGASSIITSQNAVQIYIKGNLEFTGNVSNINCVFESDQEYVDITAKGTQQTDSRKNIIMSLPSNTSRLGLYDVLIQNPVIDNPIIDPDDENPQFFKGIEVDLGEKIIQSISRYRSFSNTETIATKVENGEFNPKQNWSYFWFASFKNFVTGIIQGTLRYIGASISSLSNDTWQLLRMAYRYQRQFDDITTELGVYQVGSAPFQVISTRNGIKITKNKWSDKPDGLYREKDAGYNFEDYAKQVADLEFEKIQTINGVVAPKTSASIVLSIDTYYFYDIKLLTRINIDNTTQSGIFKNNQGFPVSVKTVTISSQSMNTSLLTDNLKSDVELQEIDDRYPDEESDEFNFPAESVRNFTKFDPNSFTTIQ